MVASRGPRIRQQGKPQNSSVLHNASLSRENNREPGGYGNSASANRQPGLVGSG
jgi:hypothetical protein